MQEGILLRLKPFKSNSLNLFFLLGFGFFSFGQSEEYKQLKSRFPDDSRVLLSEEKVVNIRLDDDQIKITQEVIEEDMLLGDNARFATKESVEYSTFFNLKEIEASSFVFEKQKYKEYAVEEFVTKDEISESFYDDTRSVNFLYANLEPGAKRRLRYKMDILNPRFLTPIYFADSNPILHRKATLVVDKGVNIRFQKFNLEGANVRFSESEKKGKKIYTWEIENQQAFEFESGAPSYKTVLPHVIPIITSVEKKGEVTPILSGVDNLYDWYYSLVENINQNEVDSELSTIVDELTKDKDSNLEKVRAIYYWVQENIKYIDFEYALGGFIPREANNVFKKKYGDCKDNSSILAEMLEVAGLEGQLTWIGTRSIPYKYREVPTPAVDNHMILSYEDGSHTYYLDATGRFIPLELPTSFIQGKEALVSNGKGNFEIKEIPIVPASSNILNDEITITVEGKKIKGDGNATFTGYKKTNIYNFLESKTENDKINAFYKSLLEKGNNKFIIHNFKEYNKFSYDDPFNVTYNFEIGSYCSTYDDELYINLNLDKSIVKRKIKEDRVNAIELNFKYINNLKTILKIPEGKTVDYLPENLEVDDSFFKASITYSVKDDTIVYEQYIEIDTLVIEPENHETFNNVIKKLEKAYKEVVVLK